MGLSYGTTALEGGCVALKLLMYIVHLNPNLAKSIGSRVNIYPAFGILSIKSFFVLREDREKIKSSLKKN